MTIRANRTLIAVAAIALSAPGTALAADDTTMGATTAEQGQSAAVTPAPLDASTLREVNTKDDSVIWPEGWASADKDLFTDIDDFDIYGPDGDQIGEVEEALADAEGRVVAFGVETEGFLDIGDADVIVPIERLELNPEGDAFITNMTEDEMEALPEWED